MAATSRAVANVLRLESRVHITGRAFSDAECDAVRDWVRDGGSLLLMADHAPAGEAAQPLAARFGVQMTDWYAEDGQHHDSESDNWGFLIFSRENGLLLDHPITQGRTQEERINRVMTFTGQSLNAPEGSVRFLKLSPQAIEYPRRRSADHEFRPAAGDAQGVALEYGQGRVVMLGEAAMLTAPVAYVGGQTFHFMSRADYDHRQLALNIMHWLSRLLN